MQEIAVVAGRDWLTGQAVQATVRGGIIDKLEPLGQVDKHVPVAHVEKHESVARVDKLESVARVERLPWIIPTLFDVQINGGLGVNFTAKDLSEAAIGRVATALAARGVGGFAATVITADTDTLLGALRALARATVARRQIPAIHLEGPYICGADGPRGAHPREHVRDPDWEEFERLQEAAEGLIRMVTLAPERPGALRFIERLRAAGVVAAIGHTAARAAEIRAAVAAGARISTHLGNGCHALLARHDNYFWEQLGCDELWASMIPDGHHLPPAVLKAILRTKTAARLVATSDLSALAGLPPGQYSLAGRMVAVEAGGRISLPGENRLAGSGVFPDECAAFLLREAGVSPADLAVMFGVNPRRLLGIAPPRLEVGMAWDFLLVSGSELELIHRRACQVYTACPL